MIDVTWKVGGFEKLMRDIKIFTDKEIYSVTRSGVNAAAQRIVVTARNLVKKRTGRLSKAIIKKKHRDRNSEITYSIGWDYKKAKHGHLIEFGHRMVAKDGKDTGEHVPAYPHLRPALNLNKLYAVRIMRKKMTAMIRKKKGQGGGNISAQWKSRLI